VQAWAEGSTLHIRFNNPARHNALSVDMWQAVPPLLRRPTGRRPSALVVFSGAGDKAFVSGADISQFEDMRAAREAVTQYEAMAEEALMAIYHCAQPTLACIRGYCIGGGVNVAISCDIRIASDDSLFAIPAARLGLGYRLSAMKNLVDLVGVGAAKDCSSPPAASARRGEVARPRHARLPPDELAALLAGVHRGAGASNAPLTVHAPASGSCRRSSRRRRPRPRPVPAA
jgi:enoyl-CoA hydratase/carnithine racemase